MMDGDPRPRTAAPARTSPHAAPPADRGRSVTRAGAGPGHDQRSPGAHRKPGTAPDRRGSRVVAVADTTTGGRAGTEGRRADDCRSSIAEGALDLVARRSRARPGSVDSSGNYRVGGGLQGCPPRGPQGISTADRAGSLAPTPPESSGSYRASGGGSRACPGAAPRRASAPRRWRCGCRARTARPIAAPVSPFLVAISNVTWSTAHLKVQGGRQADAAKNPADLLPHSGGSRTRSRFCEIPKKPRIRWENRGALRVRTGQKTPDRTRNGWQYGWQWAAKRNIHGRVLPSPRWPAVRRQPATIRRDRDEGVHQVPARVAGCFLRHPADCLFGGPALRAAAWCTANVVVLVRRVSVAELRALSPSTW